MRGVLDSQIWGGSVPFSSLPVLYERGGRIDTRGAWGKAGGFLFLSPLPLLFPMARFPPAVGFRLGVRFRVPSELRGPEKVLQAGAGSEGTRSSPRLAFTQVNADYSQDVKAPCGMGKRLVQLKT